MPVVMTEHAQQGKDSRYGRGFYGSERKQTTVETRKKKDRIKTSAGWLFCFGNNRVLK